MPLLGLSEQPRYMTKEQHEHLQQSTPSSFIGHDPVLRLRLEGVRCLLQPVTAWPSDRTDQEAVRGVLFITESAVSFLPHETPGFSLDFPSLSLHAISRTVPQGLQETSQSESGNEQGCVYCQLDLSGLADRDNADEEQEGAEDEMAELWIIPQSSEDLEPLFEALSSCASLHPSLSEGDGGNPFASLGAFGTGASNGASLEVNGAFDDADETQEGDAHLSDAGRATLQRLDNLLKIDEDKSSSVSSLPASFHSSDPRNRQSTTEEKTCTLILVNLPGEIFDNPTLASSLLDLLHAYGEMQYWTPLPSFGRAIIVYHQVEGARRAKEALDRLLLPLIDEGDEEAQDGNDISATIEKQSDSGSGLALRVYYGDTQALSRLRSDMGIDHLPVPTTDRNFLISPPGSPPVGWEPVREDPPNTNTLADDLIRALGSLRDRGLGVSAHTPTILQSDRPENSSSRHSRTPSASTLMPPPSVIIPPGQAAVRSYHPLAHLTYNAGNKDVNENNTISLPGVTVQNVDSHEDAMREMSGLDDRLNKNLSISSVKATVESMRGESASSTYEKITPTARPPLD